jgi:hypothetical protein
MVVHAVVAMEVGYLFAARSETRAGLTWSGLRGTPAIWAGIAACVALQAAFGLAPPLQAAFGTVVLGPAELALCLAAGALPLLAVEADKAWRRRPAAGLSPGSGPGATSGAGSAGR